MTVSDGHTAAPSPLAVDQSSRLLPRFASYLCACVYLNWFDIPVQDHALLEVSQRDAELFGVGADGAQTQSDAAEFFDHLHSVDTRRQTDRHANKLERVGE